MDFLKTVAQIFGICGLLFTVISYQERNNKRFFIKQGIAGLMFFVNFMLIGAFSGALFNLVNLVRGTLLSKNDKKPWRLILIEVLYTACFLFSIMLTLDKPFQIFLSALTYFTLVLMTVFMWKGNGKHIRYFQLAAVSPSWLIHNMFNFSLGGILCEIFCMISVIVSFVRYRKDGFEA